MHNDAPTTRRRERVVSAFITSCWFVQIAALVSTIVWISLDGQFANTLQHSLRSPEASFANDGTFVSVTTGMRMLVLLMICSAVSLIGIIIGLFHGSLKHRRLRSWFVLTALVAAWLGLSAGWRDLGWWAQQQRLKIHLASFEQIAASLEADWPHDDGQRIELGAFMAYPIGQPTMLMVIAPPTDDARPRIVSVEKTADGRLLLELAGNDSGVWLERHPKHHPPQSFTGGLLTSYRLAKSAPLAAGWYLSVYDVTTWQQSDGASTPD